MAESEWKTSLAPFGAYGVDEVAKNVGPAGLEIAYRRHGSKDAPAMVLIMGGAAQLIHWPDGFCAALVERGLQVIRFDNRDCGLSAHFKDAPAPDFPAVMAGDYSSASYTLVDMAADTVGLMDALGIERAHVVGASMGGQIAQIVATEHGERVKSLVSMMSTTGAKDVGQVSPEVLKKVFGGPGPVTREETIAHRVMAMKAVGSPGYPCDEEEVAARAGLAYDRANDPVGLTRQAIATVATGDRTERLKSVRVPTLVIHGLSDAMCDVSGGRATAAAIKGAELVLIEGMGHDMAPGLRGRLVETIAEFVWRVEKAGSRE